MSSPTTSSDERNSTSIGWQATVVVALVVIVVAAVMGAVAVSNVSSGPSQSGTLGWYALNNSPRGISLSFPICSFVEVTWYVSVADGAATNFSIFPPEFEQISDCHGPPPSNGSCPPSVCGYYSNGGAPVCFETGYDGQCFFTATQTAYDFLLWTQPIVTNLGNLTVAFFVDYGPPVYT